LCLLKDQFFKPFDVAFVQGTLDSKAISIMPPTFSLMLSFTFNLANTNLHVPPFAIQISEQFFNGTLLLINFHKKEKKKLWYEKEIDLKQPLHSWYLWQIK